MVFEGADEVGPKTTESASSLGGPAPTSSSRHVRREIDVDRAGDVDAAIDARADTALVPFVAAGGLRRDRRVGILYREGQLDVQLAARELEHIEAVDAGPRLEVHGGQRSGAAADGERAVEVHVLESRRQLGGGGGPGDGRAEAQEHPAVAAVEREGV